jgi:hypothetical protein
VRALVLGSLLGGVVLLGGCDSDEPPTSGPTPTPSSTTSSTSPSPPATPTPTPSNTSTIPAAARKNTPEGAEAFLKFYFSAANEAWTTPDVSLIQRLGTRGCEFCTRTEDAAVYLEEHGERYAEDPVTVLSVKAFGGAPTGEQYLAVKFRQNAVAVVDAKGAVARSDPEAVITGNAALRWTSGRWLLRGVESA